MQTSMPHNQRGTTLSKFQCSLFNSCEVQEDSQRHYLRQAEGKAHSGGGSHVVQAAPLGRGQVEVDGDGEGLGGAGIGGGRVLEHPTQPLLILSPLPCCLLRPSPGLSSTSHRFKHAFEMDALVTAPSSPEVAWTHEIAPVSLSRCQGLITQQLLSWGLRRAASCVPVPAHSCLDDTFNYCLLSLHNGCPRCLRSQVCCGPYLQGLCRCPRPDLQWLHK